MSDTPTSVRPRTWKLWERPAVSRRFQITGRDVEIVRQVYRHRFLRPDQIHALLGGSPGKIGRRLHRLWAAHYLERPQALRPLRCLTEQLVYTLGPKWTELVRPSHELPWNLKKQLSLPFIDRELAAADL